ncbi:MAG: RNA 2',3'-cyclic phosphodiesterase [Promethearchaeota archaeon]
MNKRIRAFFAFEIKDQNVLKNISVLQNELISALQPIRFKPVEIENIHLTLRFLGDIDINTAMELYDFANENINSAILQKKPLKFDVVGLSDFNKRTFFVNLEGNMEDMETLKKIQSIIENELITNYNFKRDKPFKAHITIGRAKINYKKQRGKYDKYSKNRDLPGNFKLYLDLKKKYKDKKLGSVVFEKLFLKKSTLTPKGPIYENLQF